MQIGPHGREGRKIRFGTVSGIDSFEAFNLCNPVQLLQPTCNTLFPEKQMRALINQIAGDEVLRVGNIKRSRVLAFTLAE